MNATCEHTLCESVGPPNAEGVIDWGAFLIEVSKGLCHDPNLIAELWLLMVLKPLCSSSQYDNLLPEL